MHSLSNFSSFTSHSKTLSHTFSTSNISSISCQRKYSCQSITEDEQQELSDEQEIKYIKYLQVLYEKHQNEEAYELEIKNNMKELNDLRERNIEDQKKLNEQMYYSETMKELKRWEEIMDKEAELLTPICDAFDVCLPIYQKVINALEIQSNKLPVKNIVPFMTDNEESSANQTQIHELIQSTAEISAAIAELQTLLDLGPNSVPLKVLAVEQEILDMTKDIAENEKELKRLNGLESGTRINLGRSECLGNWIGRSKLLAQVNKKCP
ncbi:uncharacterized protein LOC135930773 [Gordionus sp. m RMFG-2023]|uniref:uncharacterized protein LOC135930773 n=1 Tax=Gordionus sp. m RMFG-2023 TaxID=3053472 RepID=UPI0031FBC13D